MINFRPILFIIGILLTALSVFMMLPAAMDAMDTFFFNKKYDHYNTMAFLDAAFITLSVGVLFILSNRKQDLSFTIKQTFLTTTSIWVFLSIFASLPFMFSTLELSLADSFFEAMSGLTTTGATVMTGLDDSPRSILLWRSILQWIGGIGVVVIAIAILPTLKIGGMQLFKTESSDRSDKILPKAAQISAIIMSLYAGLTIICAILLFIAGMSVFDAICHGMTTVATGGFSTHDASIGYFNNINIEIIMMVFMVISSIPFVLTVQAILGKPKALFIDDQVRWFLSILLLVITVTVAWLYFYGGFNINDALRFGSFNMISIITTAGFSSTNYALWGPFIVTFFFMAIVIGGCTGSTTGGIKILRYKILYESAKSHIKHMVEPHGVFKATFNERHVNEEIINSVQSFFILFAFAFLTLAVTLSFFGLDFITAMSASAATLANVGPGLGNIIGPAGTFVTLPDGVKWLLSFAMLLGRLEIFTIVVLLSRNFWND